MAGKKRWMKSPAEVKTEKVSSAEKKEDTDKTPVVDDAASSNATNAPPKVSAAKHPTPKTMRSKLYGSKE